MKTIEVTIEGITPLLMNRFPDADPNDGAKAPQNGDKGTPREQADPKVYSNGHGPYIPGANIYAGMIEAGKFQKIGKSKLTTQKSSLVPSGVFLPDAECLVKPNKWEVDSRPVVIPSTGGRIICHRPRFDEWGTKFTVQYDDKSFSEKTVRQLVDDLGTKLGLGDYRPQRKGPFGRFKVTNWKKI
jgi:hypothetical protein